jgi:hypothetical protein
VKFPTSFVVRQDFEVTRIESMLESEGERGRWREREERKREFDRAKESDLMKSGT